MILVPCGTIVYYECHVVAQGFMKDSFIDEGKLKVRNLVPVMFMFHLVSLKRGTDMP